MKKSTLLKYLILTLAIVFAIKFFAVWIALIGSIIAVLWLIMSKNSPLTRNNNKKKRKE